MDDDNPGGSIPKQEAVDYKSLALADLEKMVVTAVLEHRRLLAADQAVYNEWIRAEENPTNSAAVLKSLQNEYLARQKKTSEQQQQLSEMLEVLGYVPDV